MSLPTVQRLADALAVTGVRHEPGELALMAERVAAQTARAARVRGLAIPQSVVPAHVFDPRPVGWHEPALPPWHVPDAPTSALPQSDEDIAFAAAGDLAAWIRTGLLTSERLTRIYLERIARLNDRLLCFATVLPEQAMAQARAADGALASGQALSALHGVPYACKDLLDTAGVETAWGAGPYRGRIPAQDATIVARLAAAGAVLLGKTSVGALAMGDVWYGGQTRNPWNLQQGSEGSSAGSGSAVAAALCGFAIGTETLGSIVCPSKRCGTTGLRPTFGRVPRHGTMTLSWSLDKIGPMTRDVRDAALVLQQIAGPDGQDLAASPIALAGDLAGPVAGLRVGYYPADLEAAESVPLDREMIEAVRDLGCEMAALTRPDWPYDALMHVLSAEAAAFFEELTLAERLGELPGQGVNDWPNEFRAARLLSAVDHVQLDRFRRMVMDEMARAFATVDAIVGPPEPGPMLTITNFTGHPCLILRAGFLESGAPHGVCLWGGLFDEAVTLRLGLALERRLGVGHRRPALA